MSDSHGRRHPLTRLRGRRGCGRSLSPSRWPTGELRAAGHLGRAKDSRHGSYADRIPGPATGNMEHGTSMLLIPVSTPVCRVWGTGS